MRHVIHSVMFVTQRTLLTVVISVALVSGGCGRIQSYWARKPLVFSGTVETREIHVGSKIGGRVTEVLVEEGQEVGRDALLVRLETSELAAQIKQSEAQIEQQKARLRALQTGARPEEKAQARAATETAKANLDAVRNWPRPEEVAQARASLEAAEADVTGAEAVFERTKRLLATGDAPQQDFDSAKSRLDSLKARRTELKRGLELLLNGSRPEDVRAGEQKYKEALEAERLVFKGPRAEEIEDARAQLAEAQARLDQLKVQLDESAVRSPAQARVEVVSVRPVTCWRPTNRLQSFSKRTSCGFESTFLNHSSVWSRSVRA